MNSDPDAMAVFLAAVAESETDQARERVRAASSPAARSEAALALVAAMQRELDGLRKLVADEVPGVTVPQAEAENFARWIAELEDELGELATPRPSSPKRPPPSAGR